MSEFYVGQKVVYVGGPPQTPANEMGDTPVQNGVYTIQNIHEYDFRGGVMLGLWLKEIRRDYGNAGRIYYPDCPWGADCFRPLEEKPDSIEIFRQIARDVTAGKKVVILEPAQ